MSDTRADAYRVLQAAAHDCFAAIDRLLPSEARPELEPLRAALFRALGGVRGSAEQAAADLESSNPLDLGSREAAARLEKHVARNRTEGDHPLRLYRVTRTLYVNQAWSGNALGFGCPDCDLVLFVPLSAEDETALARALEERPPSPDEIREALRNFTPKPRMGS